MAQISFDDVSKTYEGGYAAVCGLTLQIEDGEFMVLVGPSGCGKSTALRMIAGLEEITGGTIRIGGQPANDLAPRDRNIAMVFQSYALYPHLTVAENMAFGLRVRGADRTTMDAKVRQTAALLELTDYLDRKPAKLSGGQRQRVAMGRALVRSPNAFLMDEPLSNLDARLRGQMRAEIANLQRLSAVTTVYVTHDQVEAMTMGHRVAVMNKGALQQLGTPRSLYDRPRNLFVASFIGAPPINFLRATVDADGTGPVARVGDASLPLGTHADRLGAFRGSQVILGIRPEAFVLLPSGADHAGAIRSEVSFVEDLGATLLVHCAPANGVVMSAGTIESDDDLDAIHPALRLVTPGTMTLRRGDPVAVTVASDAIHVFDAGTGSAL